MGMPFQFTHSGRGATYRQGSPCTRRCRFNSRTLGRVRRRRSPLLTTPHDVSIHAPREGCDQQGTSKAGNPWQFQFTHPGRGATHASSLRRYLMLSFNSRTPGGVRLTLDPTNYVTGWFQFTHPGRGATSSTGAEGFPPRVSIHAPREGCDAT